MKQVNIIFSKTITPRDDTFNGGVQFKEVTFDGVIGVKFSQGFVHVEFDDATYSYNNMDISRIRVKGFDEVI